MNVLKTFASADNIANSDIETIRESIEDLVVIDNRQDNLIQSFS